MGTSSSPENVSTDRKSVVGELIHGRDLATQLQTLLRQPFSQQRSVSAEDLVVKILRSFTESLVVMRCYEQYYSGDTGGGSASESRTCSKGVKNRRGCYKRRKNSETRTWISCTIEDGHAWRKYGQKEILNSKFPRSYYRCTRKHEQGCRATKQVQRMEGDIVMYHTTYIGLHTCRDILKATQFIGSSSNCLGYDPSDHKVVGGSESKEPQKVQEMKSDQVVKEETVVSDLSADADNVSSMEESINLWSGLEALDSYMPASMVSPRRGACDDDHHHHGDHHHHQGHDVDCTTMYSRNATSTTTPAVTATSTSINAHDMDFVLECLDFQTGNHFHFDETVQFF